MLTDAKIPVVLLDRDIVDYPQRSKFDVVGIDNRRAGCVATQHLIDAGCRRIGFIGRPHLAPSCVARYNGYRDTVTYSVRYPSHPSFPSVWIRPTRRLWRRSWNGINRMESSAPTTARRPC